MNLAKRIALVNCADIIEADLANGAEYLTQHPFTHVDLTEHTVKAVEKEMRTIAQRLRERSGGDKPW